MSTPVVAMSTPVVAPSAWGAAVQSAMFAIPGVARLAEGVDALKLYVDETMHDLDDLLTGKFDDAVCFKL
eukprot:4725308-Pyramimonas_sp.AAC.1